jgi:dCMP deaminase
MKTPRQDWDSYFMNMAIQASTRATCPRKSVGSVIVKDKHVISTGYNGSIPGGAHCTDVGCMMEDGRKTVIALELYIQN